MTTTPLADLIPEVRTHLKGAPEVTVTMYLRRAARQFSEDSRIWTVRMPPKQIITPDQSYGIETIVPIPETGDDAVLTIPESSNINSLSEVRVSDAEAFSRENSTAITVRYDVVRGEIVVPYVALTSGQYIHIEVVLEPVFNTTTLPTFMVDLWSEAIIDYTIWKMLIMPNQEWSDPQLAVVFKSEYNERLAEATVHKARGGTQSSIDMPTIEFI